MLHISFSILVLILKATLIKGKKIVMKMVEPMFGGVDDNWEEGVMDGNY